MESYRLKITDILAGARVQILPLKNDIPLDSQENCPACSQLLRPLCLLTNKKQNIRTGLCSNCGYMGYMDRPSHDWMINFYNQEWDKAMIKSVDQIRSTTLQKNNRLISRQQTFSLVNELVGLDKNKIICEIGCGYGEVLQAFAQEGFNNLIGIENSQHRADLVNQALGFRTLSGDFESEMVQQELKKVGPIGLIFSHHVLEHTYDPNKIIKKAANLQKEGDYLILSLPNAQGEHINYSLLYLVHLHSFTKRALELLLNKYGYEITVDKSPNTTNIIVAARKTNNPRSYYQEAVTNNWQSACQRIKKALFLDEMIINKGSYRIKWQQINENDFAKLEPTLSSLHWQIRKLNKLAKEKLLKKFWSYHELLIEPLPSRASSNVPFELIFDGPIKFLIK